MRFIALLPLFFVMPVAVATGLVVAGSAPAVARPVTLQRPSAHPVTFTHSLSTAVQEFVTLACAEAQAHYENSYYRVFTPTVRAYLHTVQFGVEQASGGDQPLGVRLHALNGPLTQANLTLLSAVTTTLAPQALSLVTVPVSVVVPAHQPLVVELFVPSGMANNHLLYVGSNTLGQTAPTYARAPACGQAEPVDVAALGAPEAHWVLSVWGEELINTAPSLALTAPLTVPVLTSVLLDASATTDAEGDALTFEWHQQDGDPVALHGETLSRATFLAPITPGPLVWTLTVSDALGAARSETVTVTVVAPALQAPAALTFSVPLSHPMAYTFTLSNTGLTPLVVDATAGLSPTRATTYTLTHSLSNTVEAGRALNCAQQGFNTDSSYYRVFNLPVFNLSDQDVYVSGVTLGVEAAQGDLLRGQPVQVRLHRLNGVFTRANLTLLGARDVWLSNQTLTHVTVPVSAVVAANSQLVVEVAVPEGVAVQRTFFMGANALGQTAPSYLRAPACGYPEPVSLSALDPSVQWVMTVHVADVPCGGLPAEPWLALAPTGGVVQPGGILVMTAHLTPTTLAGGNTTLCLSTNDPAARRYPVPLTLVVTLPDQRIFLPWISR